MWYDMYGWQEKKRMSVGGHRVADSTCAFLLFGHTLFKYPQFPSGSLPSFFVATNSNSIQKGVGLGKQSHTLALPA